MGAGTIAAQRYGAAEIVDARPYAVGSVAEVMGQFPHLSGEIPALGYSPAQLLDLAETLRHVPADTIVDATPANLARLLVLDKPIADVRYEFRERGHELAALLERFDQQHLAGASQQPRARHGGEPVARLGSRGR